MTDASSPRPLRLVALTWTRIDGDVIEEFVRHTARFVDRHYIVDLRSPDRTAVILDRLIAAGLPLVVRTHDRTTEIDFHSFGEHARAILRDENADYLLALDADEFVVADDRAHLESALRALPAAAHGSIPWRTYVPSVADDPSEPRVLARLRHRRARESVPYVKVVVNRSFASEVGWTLEGGSHAVTGQGSETQPLPGIVLAHFPVREARQIQAKGLVGWTSMLASGYDERSPVAFQWRSVYDRVLVDHRWTPDDFRDVARSYLGESDTEADLIDDPLPPVARTCSNPMPDLLDVSLALSRELALAYASRTRDAARSIVRYALPAFAGHLDEMRIVDSAGDDVDAVGARVVSAGSRIFVRGWIVGDAARGLPIRVHAIFGERSVELVPGQDRPDVADALGSPDLSAAGFTGTVSLDGVSAGSYVLRIAAEDTGGLWYVLDDARDFEITPSWTAFPSELPRTDRVAIDIADLRSFSEREATAGPLPAFASGDVMVVRGSARERASGSPPAEIYAVVDGRLYTRGLAGLVASPGADAYRVHVQTRSLDAGEHILAIYAVAADGTSYSISETVPFRVEPGRRGGV